MMTGQSLGKSIVQGLSDSGLCKVVTKISGKLITVGAARKAIMSGRYRFAVIVPTGSTRRVHEEVEKAMVPLFYQVKKRRIKKILPQPVGKMRLPGSL